MYQTPDSPAPENKPAQTGRPPIDFLYQGLWLQRPASHVDLGLSLFRQGRSSPAQTPRIATANPVPKQVQTNRRYEGFLRSPCGVFLIYCTPLSQLFMIVSA